MNISAKIIADSINADNVRITTFELEFPRIILAEFNTHRMFSRNAASTRAIPLAKQIEYIETNGFTPSPFTKNQPGMVANEPIEDQESAVKIWNEARDAMVKAVLALNELGVAKQHAGRLLEPFSTIKVVLTATDYANFFWLRAHRDAQPEIRMLAELMLKAFEESTPTLLTNGEWHMPYFLGGWWSPQCDGDRSPSLEDALAISASCCAQVSYRKNDDSLEKAKEIFKRLVESEPVHASPFEHQAKVGGGALKIELERSEHLGDVHGYTSLRFAQDYHDVLAYSGNFRGWVQHRQLIKGNAKEDS